MTLNFNLSPFVFHKPKEIFLCYRIPISEKIDTNTGKKVFITEWRQATEELNVGSLIKNPKKKIIEYAYFTKKEIKNIQREE